MNDGKLIDLVHHYPLLYDFSNPKYMDTDLKTTTWNIIGKQMKTTGILCKSRWANIRDNFRKSLKKHKTISGQKLVKPYRYSEQLGFLVKFFEDRESVSNIETEGTSQDVPVDDEGSDSFSPENDENSHHDSTEVNNPVIIESLCDVWPNSKQTSSVTCPVPRKKLLKRLLPNSQPPNTATVEYLVKKHENTDSPPSSPHHPVDAFLSGLAPALKMLPPLYWHYAKADLFAAVQKYELKMLMDQDPLSESVPGGSTPIYFQ